MMIRRPFLCGLMAILSVALAAEAQSAGKVYRIGLLSVGGATADMVGPQPGRPATIAFLRGMRELGYVYGEHFVTEPRAEERPERFAILTAESVSCLTQRWLVPIVPIRRGTVC